jgi:hypothetical protein
MVLIGGHAQPGERLIAGIKMHDRRRDIVGDAVGTVAVGLGLGVAGNLVNFCARVGVSQRAATSSHLRSTPKADMDCWWPR